MKRRVSGSRVSIAETKPFGAKSTGVALMNWPTASAEVVVVGVGVRRGGAHAPVANTIRVMRRPTTQLFWNRERKSYLQGIGWGDIASGGFLEQRIHETTCTTRVHRAPRMKTTYRADRNLVNLRS